MIPVPQLWPGGTVAVIASGPSLTQAQVDYVRDKVHGTIAVNGAYLLAPWADVLYGCDGNKFWVWHNGVPSFKGLKYMMWKPTYKDNQNIPRSIPMLGNAGESGLSLDPSSLCTGKNSAYQALNLSVLMGARRVVLLGVDMKEGPKGEKHFHADHPNKSQPPHDECLALWPSIVEPLQSAGVQVINCSPDSALNCFRKMPLESVAW